MRDSVKRKMREFSIPEERISHGEQVCDLAMKIAGRMEEIEGLRLNHDHIIAGSIIHDAGFTRCSGKPVTVNIMGRREVEIPEDVILHGMHGAAIAKEMGYAREVQLIILRHELIAVTRAEREHYGILPLPDEDVVPETWEEKAVMYADGIVWLALGLGLNLWKDPRAPARGFYDILKAMVGGRSRDPVTHDHPVLDRSNRLNAELKHYADPAWVGMPA
jgi:hypothetical protein